MSAYTQKYLSGDCNHHIHSKKSFNVVQCVAFVIHKDTKIYHVTAKCATVTRRLHPLPENVHFPFSAKVGWAKSGVDASGVQCTGKQSDMGKTDFYRRV